LDVKPAERGSFLETDSEVPSREDPHNGRVGFAFRSVGFAFRAVGVPIFKRTIFSGEASHPHAGLEFVEQRHRERTHDGDGNSSGVFAE